jgi:hypothetical protein
MLSLYVKVSGARLQIRKVHIYIALINIYAPNYREAMQCYHEKRRRNSTTMPHSEIHLPSTQFLPGILRFLRGPTFPTQTHLLRLDPGRRYIISPLTKILPDFMIACRTFHPTREKP